MLVAQAARLRRVLDSSATSTTGFDGGGAAGRGIRVASMPAAACPTAATMTTAAAVR